MLPRNLYGPGESIEFVDSKAFLERAFHDYPDLHPDFIRQACCEHPDRMNSYFPEFDLGKHRVVSRLVTAEWVADNVRYDDCEALDTESFYGFHFDESSRLTTGYVFKAMNRRNTWPFPPIIVAADFAHSQLGASIQLGCPYHLFEGTHRVSYLLKMLELGRLTPQSPHEVLEISSKLNTPLGV